MDQRVLMSAILCENDALSPVQLSMTSAAFEMIICLKRRTQAKAKIKSDMERKAKHKANKKRRQHTKHNRK